MSIVVKIVIDIIIGIRIKVKEVNSPSRLMLVHVV